MAIKLGKISIIPKEYTSDMKTQESSLRDNGFSRAPGTHLILFPFRENNGSYRNGLNENSREILSIQDDGLRASIQKNIIEIRKDLERKTQIDLSPTSSYYNFASTANPKVSPYYFIDGDNVFDLSNPYAAITYYWLKSHPRIAPSLEDYNAGKVSGELQYYVNDTDAVESMEYAKKKRLNDAVGTLGSLSLDRRKKVARLMGLPYSDDSKEEVVYNGLDDLIRKRDFDPMSVHYGKTPIAVFEMYTELESDALDIQDMIGQAFSSNIYRTDKGGKIFEGTLQVWNNKEAMLQHLLDNKNQNDRLELEKKLKLKKVAES